MTEQTPSSKKGHATPSRKDAESARKQTLKPARGSKAAKTAARRAGWEASSRARKALYTNDEANLPIRDKGPIKRLVRNYVDRRVSVGELFVPFAFFVTLILLVAPNAKAAAIAMNIWTLMFVGIFIDSVVLGFLVKREVRRRFPDESLKGVAFYGVFRALVLRPMRLPKPMVKIGGAPRTPRLPRSLRDK